MRAASGVQGLYQAVGTRRGPTGGASGRARPVCSGVGWLRKALIRGRDAALGTPRASAARQKFGHLDIVFVDTTSTYWETETADDDLELADPVTDDEHRSPAEAGARAFGHSKDHRPDLPQVVIAMAVTRDGVPVRCWTFPGDTADTAIIRTVKDDLGGWGLRRLVWVADRGSASAANRAYLTRGGGHYIHAEKLRHTNTEAAARAGPPRPLPHRRRQPAGQGSARSPPAGTVTATRAPAPKGS